MCFYFDILLSKSSTFMIETSELERNFCIVCQTITQHKPKLKMEHPFIDTEHSMILHPLQTFPIHTLYANCMQSATC